MRITCDVDVVNRVLPSHNLKKASRPSRAQLSIGKKPGNGPMKDDNLFLMLCTAKDKNGVKYLIRGNIEQVFTKFIQEGKATIRFKQPEQDICISKADVIQLKSFLSVLRLALQGKNLDNITLSSLAPASSKNLVVKTSLVILNRREYPLTSNFPSCLESLQVSECRMKRIDSRIFNLWRLVRLDLSNNSIETVPDDIAKLTSLSELNLSHNKIVTFPVSVCRLETLQKSLSSLDLSHNEIQLLPLQICEFINLISFKVDSNQLSQLPPTIGRLFKLKFLSVSENKLTSLPAGFMKLRLDSLDLFNSGGGISDIQTPLISGQSIPVPSLLECSARAIRQKRVPYSPEDIHIHLCHLLDSARQCWCGNYCFHASVKYTTRVDLRHIASTVTAVDLNGGTSFVVDGFLCSPQCLRKFQQNPLAYWK